MISTKELAVMGLMGFLSIGAAYARAQRGEYLSGDEQEKLRDAQDPSQRIKAYLDFAQARLDRLRELEDQPAGSGENTEPQLNGIVGQYISITDEMKDWIDDQFQAGKDMRTGLHDLIVRGPGQLDELRHLEASFGDSARDYRKSLQEAIDNLGDAIDGGTKAFSDQEKRFAELKKDEKLQATEIKAERKEQEKRLKEEKRLRKRLDKENKKNESDGN